MLQQLPHGDVAAVVAAAPGRSRQPLSHYSTGSFRESHPSPTSCSTTVALKVLVALPIRNLPSLGIGLLVFNAVVPAYAFQEPPGCGPTTGSSPGPAVDGHPTSGGGCWGSPGRPRPARSPSTAGERDQHSYGGRSRMVNSPRTEPRASRGAPVSSSTTTLQPNQVAPHSSTMLRTAAAWLPVSIQSSTRTTRSPGPNDERWSRRVCRRFL